LERKRVGIVLFDDVEVLDFCGPFEVFSVARLNEHNRQTESSPFEVVLVAESSEPVSTTGGMKVLPDFEFSKCPSLDILVVPGGWGTRTQVHNARLLQWLNSRARSVELLTAVCTGSMLLGFAGLLDGRRATTHWRSLDWMRESFSSVMVESGKHFVEDGNLWTSAGISAGIDMSLRIVAHCCGDGVARAAARHMEYPYPKTDERRIQI
jgi:transcriptional regulator GlxA family with amidase domain